MTESINESINEPTTQKRSKAFFINGGAGRIITALPALEYHIKNIDSNAIIIAEGWQELYLLNKTVSSRVYTPDHKGLIDILKDYDCVSPEPYRLNEYYTQKVNLVQAFDILINKNDNKLTSTLEFSKEEESFADKQIESYYEAARLKPSQKPIIVIQPFGSGARVENDTIIDPSGRSFHMDQFVNLCKKLSKDYLPVIMTNLQVPIKEQLNVILPENMSLNGWASIISKSKYVVSCDSFAHHISYACGVPTTVILGSTFPENVSYKENSKYKIIDLGKNKRRYSPIRIGYDQSIERNNENLMNVDDKIINTIYKQMENI